MKSWVISRALGDRESKHYRENVRTLPTIPTMHHNPPKESKHPSAAEPSPAEVTRGQPREASAEAVGTQGHLRGQVDSSW